MPAGRDHQLRQPAGRLGLAPELGNVVAKEEILELYPYLEEPDIAEALAYVAWRAEEIEVPLASA
jgi:hypothetical protein